MSTLERNKLIAAELRGLADLIQQCPDDVVAKILVNAKRDRYKTAASEFLPNVKTGRDSRGVGRTMLGERLDICVMRGDE
jgi:hypothetical protein